LVASPASAISQQQEKIMTQRCGIWPSHGKMERIKEMDGWIKWVETHISEGYTAYLMTWMFQQLGDPDKFKSVESH
jgi:hypothetical protein